MNIKDDSRKIKKGDTFIALKKVNDGHNYVQSAIENGASKVIVQEGLYEVETLIVPNTHEYLVNYLKENYYESIKDLKLIGMTGTNGKTTTCFLIYQALNNLGYKCAYIGTIGFYIEEKIKTLNNTTPDILELYEMLLTCKEQNCEYVVMETSSHALAMDRLESLQFDVGIFSNLTQEHLDFHKTLENYALAKQRLFKMVKKISIINYDDEYKDYFLSENSLTYGLTGGDFQITDYDINMEKTSFTVNGLKYESKLIGKHNLYNILVVIVLLNYLNIDESIIVEQIKLLKPPVGRMEVIKKDDNNIIIDYAHTPDAVNKIISTCHDLKPNRIITIIGCGGERDKAKRPIMGKYACQLSNYVIFTNDNPRGEEPQKIVDDMLQELDSSNYEIILNRKKAIIKGIQMLQKNDILLVLGKGHENYQIIGEIKYDFDDKKVILENM